MARKGENIRKRSDGRWEARIIIGYYEETGKAIYKSVYGKTYTEVRNKKNLYIQNDLLSAKQNRFLSPASDMKFNNLLEEWLSVKKMNVKESTYAKYFHLIHMHICPSFDSLSLNELNNQVIDNFRQEKLMNGKLNGHGGLSPKTVSDLLSIISQAVQFGRERGYMDQHNLIIHYPKQTKPQIQILSKQQQKTLESYLFLHKDTICAGILLSLYTGLRIGEVCGLRWEDIFLDESLIYIRRTLMRIQETDAKCKKKTKILIDKPKSDCSIRIIPIPSFLLPYLTELKKAPSCYFLTGTCQYMEPRVYSQKYRHIMKLCDLEEFNYHSLRHPYVKPTTKKFIFFQRKFGDISRAFLRLNQESP